MTHTTSAHTNKALGHPLWGIDDTCPGAGNAGYTLNTVLFEALTIKRSHGSIEEAKFASWLAAQFSATMIDGAGNLHFDRRDGTGSRTLFTAHSDTVHHTRGAQAPLYDAETGKLHTDGNDVLGADDGAGVALLGEMMDRGVPGYYIIFRGEEVGGIGSSWLAENMPGLLREFDRAIAFDRKGYSDVITHQAGVQCCSDEFAYALATTLSSVDERFIFAPSSDGVYTDTKEFIGLIPECTNCSCFYSGAHTSSETLDIAALRAFADVCCTINWETLPTVRKPVAKSSRASWASDWTATSFGGLGGVGGIESYGGYDRVDDEYNDHIIATDTTDDELAYVEYLLDNAEQGIFVPLAEYLADWALEAGVIAPGDRKRHSGVVDIVVEQLEDDPQVGHTLDELLEHLYECYTPRQWALSVLKATFCIEFAN